MANGPSGGIRPPRVKASPGGKKGGPAKALYVGMGVVAVLAAALSLLFLPDLLRPQPEAHYITANTDYVFLIPKGNGEYDVGYYNSQGQWVDLGTYHVKSDTLDNAVNVINQFNQQNMGKTLPPPYNTKFQPLDYVVVIGNATPTGKPTGIVYVPFNPANNTILLDKVNPGYWTVLVTDQNDVNKLMYALDVGYKESAYANPLSSVYTSQYPGSIIYEIKSLQVYNNMFSGGYVIVTNNNTLIPWGYMWSQNNKGFGASLPFVLQAEGNSV
ncbi:MAG: hypothetical protein ACP5HQ_06960 [Thermoprotei archaeon]